MSGLVQDYNKYIELSKILNNSWGTGSQTRSPSQSIKFTLRNDKLMKINFMMIVNMPNNVRLANEMKTRFSNEGLAMIRASITELKKRFKDSTGNSLEVKLIENTLVDDIEFLTNAQYNPSKHAYFRLSILSELT